MTEKTTLLEIEYPEEYDDPYFADISAKTYEGLDAWIQSATENGQLQIGGGGSIGLVGSTLTWTANITIRSLKSGAVITILASNISIADGEIAYVTTATRPITTQTLAMAKGNPANTLKNVIPIGVRVGANFHWLNNAGEEAGSGGGVDFGDAVFVVETGANAIANGVALKAAYTAAKSATPNGQALGPVNRAMVLIPLNNYDFDTTPLTLDTDYVDLYGLCSPTSIMLPDVVRNAGVKLICEGASVIEQVDPCSDVRLTNMTLEQEANNSICFRMNEGHAGENSVYRGLGFTQTGTGCDAVRSDVGGDVGGTFEDCHTTMRGFIKGGIFSGVARRCSGGNGSFAGWDVAATGDQPVSFTGYAEDCSGGNYSFAANIDGGNATFNGTAIRCKCYSNGFGSSLGGTGPYTVLCDGSLIDCDNASGTGSGSFGYCENGAATCSAILNRCTSGSYSFGSAGSGIGIFSGEARNCEGSTKLFGYSDSVKGEFSGKAYDCIGYQYCFGASGTPAATPAGVVTAAAVLRRCEVTSYGFGASGATPAGNDQFYGDARWCATHAGYGFACNGDYAGICFDVVSGAYCFGGVGGTTSQQNKLLFRCVASSLLHTIGVRNALWAKDSQFTAHGSFNDSVLRITDDSSGSPMIYRSELRCDDDVAARSIDTDGSARDAKIAHCLLVRPIHDDVNNVIGDPCNTVDVGI